MIIRHIIRRVGVLFPNIQIRMRILWRLMTSTWIRIHSILYCVFECFWIRIPNTNTPPCYHHHHYKQHNTQVTHCASCFVVACWLREWLHQTFPSFVYPNYTTVLLQSLVYHIVDSPLAYHCAVSLKERGHILAGEIIGCDFTLGDDAFARVFNVCFQ